MNDRKRRLFGFNKLSNLEELNIGRCNFCGKCDMSNLDGLRVFSMGVNFF